MKSKLFKLKQEFTGKEILLKNTEIQLKKEFVGLDDVIDKLIQNIRSWLTLNSIQEKPMIVNLWGLTGVGKTALIARMVELLGKKESYYRFDLGDKSVSNSLRSGIEQLCTFSEDYPVIITLDEFQHAKTLEGREKNEVSKEHNRQVWDLIDSGKISYYDYKKGYYSLYNYYSALHLLINKGLKAVNGIVTKEAEMYCEEFELDDKEIEALYLVPDKYIEAIKNLLGSKEHRLNEEIKNLLRSMDETETLAYLTSILKKGRSFSVKNFNKALIFVVGNLDEAYVMSGNNNVDIDADIFHKESLKITIPKIKKALQNRFREEQISRLGNIHIIYPAFSKDSYEKIIRLELDKIKESFNKLTGLNVAFNHSVVQLLYSEGVVPAQGIRPLLSSINYYIKGNLSLFLTEVLDNDIEVEHLEIEFISNYLECFFFKKVEFRFSKKVMIETPLTDLREPLKDDLQSVVAVHESGHAILAMCLLGQKPKNIYASSADSDIAGFLEITTDSKVMSIQGIRKYVAVYLGGMIAEKLVFGDTYQSIGSSSDVQKATSFLVKAYKTQGFYKTHLAYGNQIGVSQLRNIDKVELAIEEEMLACELLAVTVLKREKKLLLILSEILKDKRSLNQDEILELTQQFSKNVIEFHEDENQVYYREHLSKMVKEKVCDMTKTQKEVFNKIKENDFREVFKKLEKNIDKCIEFETNSL